MHQARSTSTLSQRTLAQPSLGIAFIGFSQAQKSQVLSWIEPAFEHGRAWREVTADLADALCIHDSAIVRHTETVVALRQQRSAETVVRTDRPLRPVAVASGSARSIPGCAMFDTDSQYSVINLFRKLESNLAPIRDEYAMGAALAAKHGYIKNGGVFHLVHDGRLVAIADLNEKMFGARLRAHADVLLHAEWRKRPDSAAEMPPRFMARSLTDLLWTYTSRSTQQALPSEMRAGKIGLCQLPQVPMDRLNALHVKVMACVQRQEMTLDELYEELGGSRDAIDRSVGALYYAGALSLSKPTSLQKLASRLAFPRLGSRSQGLETVRQYLLRESREPLLLNVA